MTSTDYTIQDVKGQPVVGTISSGGYTVDFGVVTLILGGGSIAGIVTANSVPYSGATISLTGTPYTTTSGSDGKYSFPGLPAGTYNIQCTAPAVYAPIIVSGIVVEPYREVTQDFNLLNVGPYISNITPNWGMTAGGTDVVIEGYNFVLEEEDGGTEIKFDTTLSNNVSVSADRLKINITGIPAHTAGAVSVTAFNPDDNEYIYSPFTYVNVPPGTVPLNIERVGADIKVWWDTSQAAFRDPKIYVLVRESATGQYSNIADDWTLITDLSDASPSEYNLERYVYADGEVQGYILHKDQVGAGYGEVYYKALQKDVIDVTATLPTAMAVGKINYTISQGYNLVSVPFVYTGENNTLDKVFGDQLHSGNVINADQILTKDDPATWGMPAAYLNSADGKWYKTTASTALAEIGINTTSGYLINNKGQETTITLNGQISRDQTVVMSSGYNMIGTVFPVNQTLNSLNLGSLANVTAGTVLNADQILIKNDPATWGMPAAYLKTDGKWYKTTEPEVEATFTFQTPYGYFYRQRATGAITWLRDASLIIGGE